MPNESELDDMTFYPKGVVMVTLPLDDIIRIYEALSMGAEYAQEVVVEHDQRFGRDTIKNRKAAEQAETDAEIIRAAQDIAAKYSA